MTINGNNSDIIQKKKTEHEDKKMEFIITDTAWEQ